MLRPSVARAMAIAALVIVVIVPVASAGMRTRIEPGIFAPLNAPLKAGANLKITKLPLVEDNETIVLEEFSVLAPDAIVEVYDAQDKPHRVTPQAIRQYRGTVVGDPESIVFLSTRGSRVNGIIISRDHKFSVWSQRRSVVRQDVEGLNEIFIEELAADDEAAMFQTFTCGVENMPVGAIPAGLPKSLASGPANVQTNAALTGTQKTVLNLAIEADVFLYTNFGSNLVTEETFVRDLLGAASTIYARDLKTELRITYLGLHTATGPFTAVPGTGGTWDGVGVTFDALHGMLQLGDRWHNSNPAPSAARSATMLLSGDNDLAGIAWVGNLCTSDILNTGGDGYPFPYVNHYRGPYSFNGGIGLNVTDRTVPSPNGVDANFGAPNNGYWPLLQISHELGHNVQSPHTHCVALTAPEKATYSVTRDYVDICRSGEGGCYSGSQSLPAEAPGGRGTIMSYCHLLAFGNGTRFTFGQAGEAASKITNAMRAALDGKTPTLSAITAPASVPTGVGGQAASVTNSGLTYDWTITNGTFTGGGTTATGASVTFTGTTNPATLKVVGTNASGCAITDSKSVTVSAVSVNPPTNVVATATSGTSVGLTWTNSGTATSYNVYRQSPGGSYVKISTDGTVTTTPFIDGTAVNATAYRYKVRGVASAVESADSNSDFTVAITYTDPTLTANSTVVQAVHFTQLTTAANSLRALAGLGTISFTEGTPAALGVIRRSHVIELRAGIDLARTTMGFTAGSYSTDPTITIASTTVKKAHVDQMRAAMQ